MLNELKALIKSPKTWITMIGVALIPALYNLSFLGSMWDPYGNIDNLPVAVVNQDKSASLNNQTLSIGKDMVDNMSKNKALDYHFVSKKKAEQGLEDGDYYMVITLPKDLSEKATTLLTDNPQKLIINYQTTKGRSVVASKMSDTAMAKLKDSVSENVTKTYTKAVFKSMSELRDGMKTASSGGQQLVDGSQTITSNLGTLASGSQTLSTGTANLSSGLTTYTNGVSTLSSGIGSLSSGLSTYTSGVETLANGASQLASQSSVLVSGIAQLKESSSQVKQLVDGANSLTSGLQELATATATSSEDSANIQTLISGLPQLNTAIQSLNSTISGLTATNIDTNSIKSYLSDIATQAQAIINASQTDKANELAAIKSTSAYQGLTTSQQAEIVNALSNSGNTTADKAQAILTDVSNMSTALTALQSSNSSSQLDNLKTAVAQIASLSSSALPGSATALTKLSTGLSQVNTAVTNQLVPGSSQLAGGITTLNTSLTSGAEQLLTGVTAYTNVVSTISSGANTLAANNSSLMSGVSQLQTGANTLNSSSSQLTSGASQLDSGAKELASGSGQLAEGSSTLTDGLTSLTSSLKDADQQLSLVSVKGTNAKAVSKPVTTTHTDKDNVATNGIGMAPYMIAVSLMVVALSSNVIFAKSLSGEPVKNRFDWAKKKLLVNGFIATAGPIVLYGAIKLLGFEANYGWETLFFIILSAWTLMTLVTALVGWDDRYGSFLSLIMLLLQVGSAGGSYPIELSGKFFQTLHPYLPMSYVVSGLRETISMTGAIGKEVTVLGGFLAAFMVLALLIYRPKADD